MISCYLSKASHPINSRKRYTVVSQKVTLDTNSKDLILISITLFTSGIHISSIFFSFHSHGIAVCLLSRFMHYILHFCLISSFLLPFSFKIYSANPKPWCKLTNLLLVDPLPFVTSTFIWALCILQTTWYMLCELFFCFSKYNCWSIWFSPLLHSFLLK